MRWRAGLLAAVVASGVTVAASPPAGAATARPDCSVPRVSFIVPHAHELEVHFQECWDPHPGREPSGYRVELSGSTTASQSVATPGNPDRSVEATFVGVPGPQLTRVTITPFNAEGDSTSLPTVRGAVLPYGHAGGLIQVAYGVLAGVTPNYNMFVEETTRIENGEVRPEQLIEDLRSDVPGQIVDPVARLYKAYFLRLPDLGGMRYWVNRRRSGERINTISNLFARSSEFKRRYGTLTDRQFVEKLYENVLGRPGDAAGVGFWTGRITSGRNSRGTVMLNFSESTEFERNTAPTIAPLTDAFLFLDRLPTPSEATAWAAFEDPGTDTILAILDSDEYYAHVNGL